MSECLRSIDTLWTVVALIVFAFAIGARVCYEFMGGRGGLKNRLMVNDVVDQEQQRQLDAVTKQVRDLLRNKRVKRITVKRRMKEKKVGHQATPS